MDQSSDCDTIQSEDYDLGYHIGGIFIIMALSFLGTLLPIVFSKSIKSDSGEYVIQTVKCFGAGVILSTALIHMLIPSYVSFSNPCLADTWTNYSGWTGVFALTGIMLTHFIQIMAYKVIHKHDPELPQHEPLNSEHAHACPHTFDIDGYHRVTVYLLELGIATHSIIIGITLGAASSEFSTLLVALCFHQFFEGIALSAVVTEAKFQGKWIAIIMVVFYSLTTPFGMAIGTGIHSFYNENHQGSLISQGVLEGLSGGILIYDGLLNIVGPHFTKDSFKQLSTSTQMSQFIALWLGSAVMAIIGMWA